MSHLFSPLKIRGIELKNRIAVSPMCEYSSTDGFSNDWHFVHLGARAVGGAGLVITEAAAVSAEGRITASDLGIYQDEHIAGLLHINQFMLQHGAVPGVQLAHAGRKASHKEPWNGSAQVSIANGGWLTLAPSAVPFTVGEEKPQELSLDGIAKVINDFKTATLRAVEAGFKVVELHAAHGYLIHEFLSPLSNLRTDAYGGPFENRIRILIEIVEAVRSVWPDEYPLLVRISASEWTLGGWDIDDSVKLALILKTLGVDLIDCSSGGNVPHAKIPVGPGYQVPFANEVRKKAGIMTGAVGMITDAKQANAIISTGEADIILLARQLLRDPYFPLRAAHELGHDIEWPQQYQRAKW